MTACDNPECGKPNMIGVDRCEFCRWPLFTELILREKQRLNDKGIHVV
jgi:hypothetical protein